MKKVIKKILIVLCFIAMICVNYSFSLKAYTKTGHDDFLEIRKGKYVSLLNEIDDEIIEKLYKATKWKFFGWETKNIYVSEPIEYDGKIVFARTNKSSEPLTIAYSLREVMITTTSVKVTGSVSTKITGKLKKVNLDGTISGDLERESQNTIQSQRDEKTEFKITINPNKKVTIITTGTGYLTSGVSKHYLFGFTSKKGSWERIDVETTYFELREEDVS